MSADARPAPARRRDAAPAVPARARRHALACALAAPFARPARGGRS
ncbi:hypothetical protein DVA67_012385 [Solirubrobacter sp. CPCC 204708]|nr:hypothetical protein [Solirubrobacter deserti]